MHVAIIGNGDSSDTNIADLLDDFLPFKVTVFVPEEPYERGMRKVVSWLKDCDGIIALACSDPLAALEEADGVKKTVITIGTGDRDLTLAALGHGWPVLDLERGLYSVTSAELASGGSESDSQTQTPDSGTQTREQPLDESESLTETQPDLYEGYEIEKVVDDLVYRVSLLEQALNAALGRIVKLEGEIMSGIVSRETGFHGHPDVQVTETGPTVSGTTKYWHNTNTHKYRKAGKSKPRPNEVEEWLTPEEIEERI